LIICSQLLSNAIDSPAPVFGDFNGTTGPVPGLLFRTEDPLLDRTPGVGGSPINTGVVDVVVVVVVVVASAVAIIGDDFESKSLMVSRTLDFRVDVVVVVSGGFVGELSPSAVPGLLPRDDLTGLGLVPSFASNRFGREIGLGIRDFAPPDVNDPFLPPEVVLVATLVVVEVARLEFEELPPEPQTQPPLWWDDLDDVTIRGMSSKMSGVKGRSTCSHNKQLIIH
jgi:hypothetical protein